MPNLPLTYPDLVCEDDLNAYGAETTSDLQALVQDVLHVLSQTMGSNLDDPLRGVGVANYLGGTEEQFQSLAGLIEEQLNQDDRISSTSCTIIPNDDTFIVRVSIAVTGTVFPLEYGWQNGSFTNLTGSNL